MKMPRCAQLLFVLLLTSLSIAINASASAQSEEETVAFIVTGFESGKVSISPCADKVAPQLTSTSPATYRFNCKDGKPYDYIVRKMSDCKYELGWRRVNGKELESAVVMDFKKFQKMLPADKRFEYSHFFAVSAGFCTNTSSDTSACDMFPKFVSHFGNSGRELRKQEGTSNSMILVPLVDLTFLR